MGDVAPISGDQELEELDQLAASSEVDLNSELSKCSALLTRLDSVLAVASLEPRTKARAFRDVLMAVVDQAYIEITENGASQELARYVLAVGTLIGLVTEWPNPRYPRAPSAMTQQRASDKSRRREIAAGWAEVSERTLSRDRRLYDYLTAFKNAFHDFLADEPAVIELSRRLNIAVQTRDDLTREATRTSKAQPPRLGHAPRKVRGRTTYVKRQAYHARITELVHAAEPVIILGGDRGNGKSRLALEYVLDELSEPERYVYINGTALATDLAAVLTSWGASLPDNIGMPSLAPYFAQLVNDRSGPKFVLIDNVEDIELLDLLLPGSTLSTIIVTTHLRVPGYDDATLQVKEMEQREAFDLAKSLLADERDVDLESVVRILGFRPLAIVHACGFIIGKGSVGISQFLEDLSTKTAETFDVPAGAGEKTLTALYLMMLDDLGKSDRVALWSLYLVAHLGYWGIPPGLIEETLSKLRFGYEITPTRFVRAILALESRYLIEEEDEVFTIHPLTQQIIRDQYGKISSPVSICALLHGYIGPPEHYSVGRIERDLPNSYLNNAHHVLAIVRGFTSLSDEDRAKIRLGYTLTVLLKVCGQLGYRTWFLYLRSLFPDLRDPEVWHLYPSMKLTYLENASLAFNGELLTFTGYRAAIEILVDLFAANGELTAEVRLQILAAYVALEDYPTAHAMLGNALDAIKKEKNAHQPKPRMVVIKSSEEDAKRWVEITIDPATAVDYIGDHTLLASEIMLGVANLSEATRLAMDAYLAYMMERGMPERETANRRLVMRACLALIESALLSGKDADTLNAAFARLRDEWEPGAGEVDPLVQGRYWLAKLRIDGNSLLYGYAYYGMTKEWAEGARAFLVHCSGAWDKFHAANADRELLRNAYEWTIIGCLQDPEHGINLARQHAEELERSESSLALAQVQIAFAKLDLLKGKVTPRHVYEFKALAYKIAMQHGAGYWYTEALTVAMVAAAWCEMPWRGMIAALDEAHTMTQRLDKNRALSEAMYVGSENPQVFRTRIAYLLGL